MFFIAEQHFLNKTPKSIREFQSLLFQASQDNIQYSKLRQIEDLSSFLCLPVSVEELLGSFDSGSLTKYFVVDCRPPEQYNNGHFVTAFHLDCSLVSNPILEYFSTHKCLVSILFCFNIALKASGNIPCFLRGYI